VPAIDGNGISPHGADLIRSAGFAAAVPPYLPQTDDNPDAGWETRTWRRWSKKPPGTARTSSAGPRPATSRSTANSRSVRTNARRPWRSRLSAGDEALVARIDAFGRTDFRGDLEKIPLPTLVIHGDSHAIVPFDVFGKRTPEMLDDAELVAVKAPPQG
jgi:non-heme chloroperoxidase